MHLSHHGLVALSKIPKRCQTLRSSIVLTGPLEHTIDRKIQHAFLVYFCSIVCCEGPRPREASTLALYELVIRDGFESMLCDGTLRTYEYIQFLLHLKFSSHLSRVILSPLRLGNAA